MVNPAHALSAPWQRSLDVWRETTSFARCCADWPSGWVGLREGGIEIGEPTGEFSRLWPVVMVHGLGANRASMRLLADRARADGFTVVSSNFIPFPNIDTMSDRLVAIIEAAALQLGTDRVHLVGHSLGGLLCRYVAQTRCVGSTVASIQTLATPHSGIPIARWSPWRVGLELAADSAIYQRLAATSLPVGVRATAYVAGADMLAPSASEYWAEAANVTIARCGHLGIVCSKAVAGLVTTELATTEREATQGGERVSMRETVQGTGATGR